MEVSVKPLHSPLRSLRSMLLCLVIFSHSPSLLLLKVVPSVFEGRVGWEGGGGG